MLRVAANGRTARWGICSLFIGAVRRSQKFYEPFIWEGRREDVASFSPDKTMFALPPLLWRDTDIKRKLEQMREEGMPTERYFAFVFKKS